MTDQTCLPRVFKIGATRSPEDESTAQLTTDEIRDLLKRTYPEIAPAAMRERDDLENGVRVTMRCLPSKSGRNMSATPAARRPKMARRIFSASPPPTSSGGTGG